MLLCDADKDVLLEGGFETLLKEVAVIWVVALEEEEPLIDIKNELEGGKEGDGLLEGVKMLLNVASLGLWIPLAVGARVEKADELTMGEAVLFTLSETALGEPLGAPPVGLGDSVG